MPVEISDWNDLDNVRNDLSGDYVLVNDLDSGTDGYDGIGDDFQRLGVSDLDGTPFTGTFDGDGFGIKDLVINEQDSDDRGVGLFGGTDTGVVIEDLSVGGSITATEAQAGGLVGFVGGGIIQNCMSHVDVVSDNNSTGGLAGRIDGTITDCYATGSVEGGFRRTGGLVGQNDATIESSYAVGAVSGNEEVGALVGQNESADELVDSYADSEATGQTDLTGDGGPITNSETLTTSEMQGSEAETNMGGFNFDDVWDSVVEGDETGGGFTSEDGYPILVAVDDENQLEAQNISFLDVTVTVQTNPADLVSSTSATLHGEITELEDVESVDAFFEFGTNVGDNETTKTTLSDTVAFDETVENLPDTVIEFRALAEGESDGTTFTATGNKLTFETFKNWKSLIDGTELKTF